MSANTFFQPPPESTGARTIYSVLNARNPSDSTHHSHYLNDSNYSYYEPNDCFNYDRYDHDFHAFIMNSPAPSEIPFNGSNSYNSFSSTPSGSGSSYALSYYESLYKSPKFSPQAKHSRTPSSSSASSFSSCTPSLTFSSSSQSSPSSSSSPLFMNDNEVESDNSSYEEEDQDMLFDATDKAQLDAFVPPELRAAIDAAKYSSFGKFGDEICWEALPPVFDLGHEEKEGKGGAHPRYGQTVQIDWQPFDSFPNYPIMEATMESVTPPSPTPASHPTSSASLSSEFPPLSELLPEQQEKLCAFLYKHRDCVATIEQIQQIADETNLTIISIVYYLCFY